MTIIQQDCRVGNRKVAYNSARGMYTAATAGTNAYITLVVDNILGMPVNLIRINLVEREHVEKARRAQSLRAATTV